MMRGLRWIGLGLGALVAFSATAREVRPRLEIHWIDVEGGAATLIVTPAGESVLVDAGRPGRDAERVLKAVREAGLHRLDVIVVTHYHIDHFGGVAEIARAIPVGTIYENPLAAVSAEERAKPELLDYQKVPVRRRSIEPGLEIPLAGKLGSSYPSLRFVGTAQRFVAMQPPRPGGDFCAEARRKADDTSENAMSAVMVLRFGGFRIFLGGDLTWNLEEKLACPEDLVGPVDVYQSTHHGLDQSNNPVLMRTLAPSVVVFTNGPRKGLSPATVAAVRSLPSLRAAFQLHRGLADGALNTDASRIANVNEVCDGAPIRLSVHPEGKRYEVSLPSTGFRQSFDAQKR